MSMEYTEPERSTSSAPPSPENAGAAGGGGQQRRRRRRRKNRGGAANGGAGSQASASGAETTSEEGPRAPVAEAPAPAQAEDRAASGEVPTSQFRQARRPLPQQPQNNGGGGGKKKQWQGKGGGGQFNNGGNGGGNGHTGPKQFGRREREYNPGNSIYGNGGGGGNNRRKNKKGRGPAGFVGPMDHSYRAPNGNVADPPSHGYRHEREVNGNVAGGNGYYDEYDMYMPVGPVREDAPVRIILFVEDLFVVAKTNETARKLGIKVLFAKAEKDQIQAILDAPDEERPSLIVFDLNNAAAKPLTTIPKLKAKLKRGTSVIGFLSQIQGDLKSKATEAGCDMVMHKGAFSQNLPTLLRRHGIEDEEFETVEA